jgi:hypothetical protein
MSGTRKRRVGFMAWAYFKLFKHSVWISMLGAAVKDGWKAKRQVMIGRT